jgi:hypothetical protein
MSVLLVVDPGGSLCANTAAVLCVAASDLSRQNRAHGAREAAFRSRVQSAWVASFRPRRSLYRPQPSSLFQITFPRVAESDASRSGLFSPDEAPSSIKSHVPVEPPDTETEGCDDSRGVGAGEGADTGGAIIVI